MGGIKEKVLAAQRAEFRRVIVPRTNAQDVQKLPATVADDMACVFVERFDEVIQAALPALHPAYATAIAA